MRALPNVRRGQSVFSTPMKSASPLQPPAAARLERGRLDSASVEWFPSIELRAFESSSCELLSLLHLSPAGCVLCARSISVY